MAEKLLQTRIVLKHDSLENWNKDTAVVLKEGEVALAKVEVNQIDPISGSKVKVPTYLIKVGDGSKKFSELNWVAAPAADVYDWAKKTESEFTTWVKGLIDVTDIDLSAYVKNTDFDAYKTGVLNGATELTTFKAVETAIDGIETDIETNYALKTEVQAVLGTAQDEATANTVYGAKAHTDALANGAVKTNTENIGKNADAISGLAAELKTGTTMNSFGAVETEINTIKQDYATKTEAQGYANTVLGTAQDGATANTVYGAKAQAKAAQDAVDALTDTDGQVTKNTADIDTIKTNISNNYATKDYADQAEADAVATAKGYTDTEALKLQNQINTIMNNPDAEGAINSINEFTEYVTEHGTIAEGFRTDIDENAANIKALQDAGVEKNTIVGIKIKDAENNLTIDGDRVVTLGKLADNDVVAEADLDNALATKINGKVDTATFTPVSEQVELNKNAIAEIKTIEHHDHSNKEELDLIATGDKAKWDAAATAAVHENRTVLDGITAEKVTAWDAAEQNAKTYAKDYADGLAGNYDAKGAAAEVQGNLDTLETSLAAIAKSGNVNDLVQTTGDILVFNCGTASTVI